MAKKSKQLRAALEKIDSTKAYSVEEAVALAKETNFAKFDATVEVAYNLNIDVKKAPLALQPLCFFSPRCTATGDYAALCDEMLARMEG